jgi:MATE family multidrug resistance protein
VARRALALGAAYTAACTVVFVVAAGPIAVLLGGGRGALEDVTVTLVQISALFLVADAANVIARGVLRGAGDVVYPAMVGVLTSWVLTPPMAYLVGLELGWGAAGGWLGLTAEIFAGAVILWRRITRGGWVVAAEASRARVAKRRENGDEVSLPRHADETLTCEAS